MLIEIMRAGICGTCLVMGVLAVMRSEWRLFRIAVGLFIIFVMSGEIAASVNLAATNASDLGSVRKVGWQSILAAVLTIWFGRNWLIRSVPEHKR